MIATVNYLLIAKVGDERYFFKYDTNDIWETLERFWHDDYFDSPLKNTETFPIEAYAMERGKIIKSYAFDFCGCTYHAFFDNGWTADGDYTQDMFAENIRMRELKKTNDTTSFFFYMWYAWCKEECQKTFSAPGNDWQHFWNKWLGICKEHSVYGAAERFYAELSNHNRNLLVKRATEVYEGDSEKH